MARIVIVGAGMAGLAAAIDCAAAGDAVTLLDMADAPGGKMSVARLGEHAIDNGPTVLTMAAVFEQLFADAGASLADHCRLTRAEVLARHRWQDGDGLDLFADEERSADAIGMLAGAREARGYRGFMQAARTIHDALADSFMAADKPGNPMALLWRGGWRGLPGFLKLDPYRSLATMVAGHFRDPGLRQLFGRYATYCGSAPDRTPATLALVADVEARGVWLVEGGMRRLAAALHALATRLGATSRFHARVAEIVVAQGRAAGVRLEGGEVIAADQVLLTADAAALGAGLFGARASRKAQRFGPRDRSFSAFTIATAAPADMDLSRHTIFFSNDADAEFRQLRAGAMPEDPTVYVCAQARDAVARPQARAGAEPLFLVLNAPADGDTHPYTQQEIERCTDRALCRLRRSGLTLSPQGCSISTPSDFARRFPATGGALYGRASHGWMASFRRPGATTAVPGLFLAGGSVHPGAGVPMAALSGRSAARQMRFARARAHASTWPFPKAATPGGTSTPSPTTAATA